MAVVDSGCTTSVVNRKFCEQHGLVIKTNQRRILLTVSSEQMESAGQIECELRNGNASVKVALNVANIGEDEMLIGMDLFRPLGYNLVNVPTTWPNQSSESDEQEFLPKNVEGYGDSPREDQEYRVNANDDDITPEERAYVMERIQPLLDENQRISPRQHCTHPKAKLRILTGDSPVIRVKQYPIPFHHQKAVKEKIDEWLRDGIIEQCHRDDYWSFPLLAVKKKDYVEQVFSKIRLCLDLRMLNQVLKDFKFPMPTLRELMYKHRRDKYFGSWDEADSFTQWLLDERDRHKICFVFEGIVYQFCRAMFGLKILTEMFQMTTSEIIAPVKEASCFVDDTKLGAPTLELYADAAVQLLTIFNRYHIRLRIEKCVFIASQLVHVGRMLTRDGFKPCPRKINEIVSWVRPKTHESLKSFVCMCGFFREHVKNFALLVDPLVCVYDKPGDVKWTKELIDCFEKVKSVFGNSDLILIYPDFGEQFELYVDASLVGMGACLMQKQDGKLKMVGAVSKAFRSTERSYSATKRELKALIWGIAKFELLLKGGKFTVYTDHIALTFLLTQKHTNPMWERWLDFLLQFDFNVVHIPGQQNVIADALSRQYEKWKLGRKWEVQEGHRVSRLDLMLAEDFILRRLPQSEIDGKLLVNEAERSQLLRDVHELGHFGTDRMFATIFHEQGKFWPGMRKDIMSVVNECEACIKYNVQQQGYHELSSVKADMPWDFISVDLIMSLPKAETGETCCLVIVDNFTRYVLLRPLFSKSAEEVARVMWQLFADFGVVKVTQSDQGVEFLNEVFQEVHRAFGIQHRLVNAYAHQAQGQVEGSIKTITGCLKKKLKGEHKLWVKFLPITQMALNLTVSSSTGCSPYTLMFGRAGNSFMDYSKVELGSFDSDARAAWMAKQKWLCEKLFPAVGERSELSKKKSRDYRNATRKQAKPLEVGTVVFVLDVNRESKWDAVYEGPYEIVGIDAKKAYVLKDEMGTILNRHVPREHLKVRSQKFADLSVLEVESILDHRGSERDGFEYLVRWKKLDASEDSWEPQKNFNDWKIIQRYWKSRSAAGVQPVAGNTRMKRQQN